MKTFKDLVFKKNKDHNMHAWLKFKNGETVSVLYGKGAMCDENTYECWYSNESEPSAFQTEEEITKGMIYLQKYYKNAKHEILELAEEKAIRCIDIYMKDIDRRFTLPEYENNITGELGYQSDNTILLLFLEDLDYCYEDDKCKGIIWFTDGTWAERLNEHRHDFDQYYEGWIIFGCPEIPEKLLINK